VNWNVKAQAVRNKANGKQTENQRRSEKRGKRNGQSGKLLVKGA
jgi:hypothetical protein